jgi:outer membrane protein assembly factor BamB
MASDVPVSTETTSRPRTRRWLAITRLVLAWVLTLAVLVYAWARTLVMDMVTQRPESPFLILCLAGLLVVIALNWNVGCALARPRFDWQVGFAVGVPWVAANGLLMSFYAGPHLPWPYVVALFVPATLWVAWAAWMFFWPLPWFTRLAALVLLLIPVAAFRGLLKVNGLMGDARVDFAWRWERPEPDLATHRHGADTSGPVDLTRTTDHDYPQYLGPSRTGVLRGARLARDWKTKLPREVWRKPVGAGWSAFAVVGNFAVTQEQRGGSECVVCYRVTDGAQIWLHDDPVRFGSSMGGPGPRATPTIAGGQVFAVGATGILNCLDGATGQAVWSVNILTDNHAENAGHGVCGSPLVLNDRVLVCPTGHNGPSLAAYRRDTGTRLWQAGQDRASYGSPMLADLGGVRQVLLATSAGLAAHDPEKGDLLWRFDWTNGERINCSQPIIHAGAENQVFFSTGYGTGGVLLKVERSSASAWSVEQVWETRFMKTKFTTPVSYKNFIYGLDDGILACIDLASGKRRWKEGRYDHGQVLLAGDLLLVQAENGSVVLVEPNPPDFLHELGRIPALTGKTWNHPALAGRFLLVRNDQEAACFELPLRHD